MGGNDPRPARSLMKQRMKIEVPDQFGYLCHVINKYMWLSTASDLDWVVSTITKHDLAELAEVYLKIADRDDISPLSQWYFSESKRVPDRNAKWVASQIFALFDGLAAAGVEPFSSGIVRLLDPPREHIGWTSLPPELSYLIGPAERYGCWESDRELAEILESITDDEKEELQAMYRKIDQEKHLPLINEWMRTHPINQFREPEMMHSMLYGLDRIGLSLK